MKRTVYQHLLTWKQDPSRKVLLVRGARQVGKTYSVRELGKTFQNFLEVNFEANIDIHSFFNGPLNPKDICLKLAAYFSVPIVSGKTLLFFDEIQSCPQALSSLRYFSEQMPDLHVVATGSLLEFALAEIPSQGVGRISSVFMYPLSFSEFLTAVEAESLLAIISSGSANTPLDNAFHKKLIDIYKIYQFIGGLPAVVQSYILFNDLHKCQGILDNLIITYQDDFAKYKKRAPVSMLRDVFQSIAFQSGTKFQFSRVNSESTHQPLKNALELLEQAGLAYKIYHSDARGIPLGGQINQKKFKVILFDMGIQQRLLGLDLANYLVSKDFEHINRGSLAEAYVGLELIKMAVQSRPALNYWHREQRGSNAEVDYVIQRAETIIPIEVKAGTKGQMQSLHLFMQERNISRGIRCSLENFSTYDNIEVIPLYAIASKLF